MEVKALIFDLDGVLTDTAFYHYQAWKNLAGRLGMQFTQKDNERLKGVGRLESLEIILEINGRTNAFSLEEKRRLAEEKNVEYVRLIQQVAPEDVLPGILPLLKEARDGDLRLAVASASKNASTVLRGLCIRDCFDYVADARQIKNTKPHPEVFLDCASKLGVSPEECVGLEDAQAGIEAIHRAGMYAVGIGVNVVREAPDLALESTRELDLGRILCAVKQKEDR